MSQMASLCQVCDDREIFVVTGKRLTLCSFFQEGQERGLEELLCS